MTDLSLPSASPPPAPSLREIYLSFVLVSVMGFGGVLPWARRMIVERRRWLTEAEFLDLLALCQFLPGPNICNLSIAVGARFGGVKGSAAAFLGITGLPFVIVIALGALYGKYGGAPAVTDALLGVSAAASGMILAMAARLSRPLLIRRPGEAAPVMILVFAAVALLRLPLLWVLAGAIPLSIGISWWRRG
ncbi:MAG TPA: chromate transporter [Stellaceae bacterium]|nr:chromate transporter [Stellaceae bacterium]